MSLRVRIGMMIPEVRSSSGGFPRLAWRVLRLDGGGNFLVCLG